MDGDGTNSLIDPCRKMIADTTTPTRPPTDSEGSSFKSDERDEVKLPDEYQVGTRPEPLPLAADHVHRAESALGDAILRFLGLRKAESKYDPDAVSVIQGGVHARAETATDRHAA